jgi:hypothetical protein
MSIEARIASLEARLMPSSVIVVSGPHDATEGEWEALTEAKYRRDGLKPRPGDLVIYRRMFSDPACEALRNEA